MTRVSLSRLPGDRVLVVEDDLPRELTMPELAAYVREREVGEPRWVWDDTARWYPALLSAGVRVERCYDLRPRRRLLRRAPAVDVRLLEGNRRSTGTTSGRARHPIRRCSPSTRRPSTSVPTSRTRGSWPRWRRLPRPAGSSSCSRRSRRAPWSPSR